MCELILFNSAVIIIYCKLYFGFSYLHMLLLNVGTNVLNRLHLSKRLEEHNYEEQTYVF